MITERFARAFTMTLLLVTSQTANSTPTASLRMLPEALPQKVNVNRFAPRFDFQSGCYPSVGIDVNGQQNPGVEPNGGLAENCREKNFLMHANTLHRYQCEIVEAHVYCGHIFALYFAKDQSIADQRSGHRHDWEFASVYTLDGRPSHAAYSAHGNVYTLRINELQRQADHVLVVYDKDGDKTHAMRFAGEHESAQNPYGRFVTPVIASWSQLKGNGDWSTQALQQRFNEADFGAGNVPISDANFIRNLNKGKPQNYPRF